jgi:hypothetical protein
MPRKGQRQPKTPQQIERWKATMNDPLRRALWRAKISQTIRAKGITPQLYARRETS